MQLPKQLPKIFALIILSFGLNACNDSKNREQWVVGTSADNPPYEFMKNGEIIGFDIDVINAISKHLGKTTEIKNMEFHGLLAAVAAENVDMAVAGLSVTSAREKRVKFSKPYSKAYIAILTRKDDKITSQEKLAGKIIGSQLGTSWTFIAKEIAEQNNTDLINLASNLVLVEELKNKRLDAVILERSQAYKFSQLYPGLTYLPADEYHTYLAIAYPKRASITTQIDEAILELRKDGTIDRLARKWGVNGSSTVEIINEQDKRQETPEQQLLEQSTEPQGEENSAN